MLLIYVPQVTPRIEYIFRLFFGELIQTQFSLTSNRSVWEQHTGPRLNYSRQRFGNEVFIHAHNLLFEQGIKRQNVAVRKKAASVEIFAHEAPADLSFDPMAAAFYLVTRYEEYLSFTADAYGRFPDTENLLVKENIHEKPVVNQMAAAVKNLLEEKFPTLVFSKSPFQFELTYDIDFAFAFRGKGFLRTIGGYAKSLLQLKWSEAVLRNAVLRNHHTDPYDTFEFQSGLHEKFNLHPIYFFLLGDYSRLDKNIWWKSEVLQALIRRISTRNETGIHSSFASNDFPEKIPMEIGRLENLTGKKVFRNRQHFLKLKFPQTYHSLLANGITEDFTLGFSSLAGFRAGLASPFFWFDLKNEISTSLRLFPVAAMDATFRYYQHLSPGETASKIMALAREVKKVGGYFQLLAHNDLLQARGVWKEWPQHFEQLLKNLSEH
jgi:hypothetical protein